MPATLFLFGTYGVSAVIAYVCFELTRAEAHERKLTQCQAQNKKQSWQVILAIEQAHIYTLMLAVLSPVKSTHCSEILEVAHSFASPHKNDYVCAYSCSTRWIKKMPCDCKRAMNVYIFFRQYIQKSRRIVAPLFPSMCSPNSRLYKLVITVLK